MDMKSTKFQSSGVIALYIKCLVSSSNAGGDGSKIFSIHALWIVLLIVQLEMLSAHVVQV